MTYDATTNANQNSQDFSQSSVQSSVDETSTQSEKETVFEYCDKSGTVRYEKVHKEPDRPSEDESIYLRVPDKGPGMHGRDHLPYRLQEFPDPAKGDSPLITYHESERTAKIVADHDIPATTTPLGPEMNIPRDVASHFEDLQVAIFPDNDWEGRYHAGRIGEVLLDAAKCVKIVRIDGRQEGENMADWIDRKLDDGWSESDVQDAIEKAIADAPVVSEPEGGSSILRSGEFGPGGSFWYTGAGSSKVKIARRGLIDFLEGRGFRKLYRASNESSLVRVEDNVVSTTSLERVKDHVTTYLQEEVPGDRGVEDALMRSPGSYFSSSLFEFLPELTADFHRDTPDKAHCYFQNGFVEVTENGYDLHPYRELNGLIWKEQIINRPFKDLSGDESRASWEWRCLLRNVAGDEEDRLRSLRTALGYLQHQYKDPALTKVVIFMDEVDSEFADGRTGKSLVAKSLQQTCSTNRMDGRNFRFTRFAFQDVDRSTEVVDYNDARKDFPMSRLFSVTTDDMTVERKGQDSTTIRFVDAPKFLISTNYVIEGDGASFDARTFEIEFSDHYGGDHEPMDDFGHRLFEQWSDEEWARFDNTMINCIQEYLRDGLVEYEHENVNHRRLKQNTCASFAAWAVDAIVEDEVLEKDALYQLFRCEHKPDFEDLKKSTFGKWLSHFARTYDLDKVPSRPRRDGERVRCVTFVPKD